MHVLVASPPIQISLLSVDESQERHQVILAHAIAAVQNYMAMKESAARLCVSLFMCHQEFKNSGEIGWQAFCETNFHGLGLSQGNIRSAVKAGRALSHYMASVEERNESVDMARLESMSRSALIVLGEAPEAVREELIDRVVQAAEMRGSNPTAREVNAEMARILREKEEAERGQAQAMEKISEKDQAILRLNQLVQSRETQVGSLQGQIDQLQHQLASAPRPQVVVEDLDPQSKAANDKRRNLEQQIGDLQHEMTQTQANLGAAKAELERVSRQAALRKSTDSAIDELEQQVSRLKAQWSDAYAQKIRASDPHAYAPVLTRIANNMRFLADQLDPTLV